MTEALWIIALGLVVVPLASTIYVWRVLVRLVRVGGQIMLVLAVVSFFAWLLGLFFVAPGLRYLTDPTPNPATPEGVILGSLLLLLALIPAFIHLTMRSIEGE
jgi:hypothetical protein